MDRSTDRVRCDGPTAKPFPQPRRAWHAPQFLMTDISETDLQGANLPDGGGASSS
ncbi:MAG TPA: hypothetical protein VFB31_11375 [Pseudolabrys sp.]|nr:hypothetical protein [Pseudolabrys sp.]